MKSIWDKEQEDAAMAKLAKVRNHRSDSLQVNGLYAVANGRPRLPTDCMERVSFWTVTLYLGERAMVMPYIMGAGHREPPQCDNVLVNLCSDAQGYDNTRDFADWCGEYGLDTDSRKAHSLYRTLGENAKALRHLLGKDYEAIVARGVREWAVDDA